MCVGLGGPDLSGVAVALCVAQAPKTHGVHAANVVRGPSRTVRSAASARHVEHTCPSEVPVRQPFFTVRLSDRQHVRGS